jgi:hypothetical protein
MSTGLDQKVHQLLGRVQKLEEEKRALVTDLLTKCDGLLKAASGLSNTWSGSFMGYHSELYYGNFQTPPLGDRFNAEWGGVHGIPAGWKPRTGDEVKERIEAQAQATFEEIDSDTKELAAAFQELQSDIVIDLSPVRSLAGLEKEKELLETIDEYEWGEKAGNYINASLPKNYMTRDSAAAAEGVKLPAHLYYEGVAYEYRSRSLAVQEFVKLSRRFLRQLGAQLSQAQPIGAGSREEPLVLVRLICSRFHLVAKQLRERREDRPTLELKDEYDVQDLLHSLLRLHFDDIRPEEWTPSYAGNASRMDFLLKREQIVVEAKMARAKLGAKEIAVTSRMCGTRETQQTRRNLWTPRSPCATILY